MPGDYSEELVELGEQVYLDAAAAWLVARYEAFGTLPFNGSYLNQASYFRAAVESAFAAGQRALLDALSSADRLVPEGSEVREEWGNVAPSGDNVAAQSREWAERWHRQLDAPILRRMAIYGPWTPSEPAQEER